MEKTHFSSRTFELKIYNVLGKEEGYLNEIIYLIKAIDIVNQFEIYLD